MECSLSVQQLVCDSSYALVGWFLASLPVGCVLVISNNDS
jgi:hypothetical protein